MERCSDGVWPELFLLSFRFFLDAIICRREAADVMRRFAIGLTPCLFLVSLACAEEPLPPNAFMTVGGSASTTATTVSETSGDSMDTDVPQDLPTGDGDGDPGDGDPSTTNGDGDPSTSGDGDGDPDPTTGGDPECGNGVIDDGEQCDGGNLGGFDCVDLGYSGGTLGCDPITCTYDASACTTDMDGGSGTSG
jgi:hypothetical protein